ncbi:MAG TPA: aminotransferase class III-fold pyridoxal phosphate-dependent enzyme, partial [Actinomycetota bacterium]
VLDDERVIERATRVSAPFIEAIRDVASRHPIVVDVRGVGLAIGIEIADGSGAKAVKEGLRQRGVLVGTSGRGGNVLKVRPPLAFTEAEIPVFTEALDATLASLSG